MAEFLPLCAAIPVALLKLIYLFIFTHVFAQKLVSDLETCACCFMFMRAMLNLHWHPFTIAFMIYFIRLHLNYKI